MIADPADDMEQGWRDGVFRRRSGCRGERESPNE